MLISAVLFLCAVVVLIVLRNVDLPFFEEGSLPQASSMLVVSVIALLCTIYSLSIYIKANELASAAWVLFAGSLALVATIQIAIGMYEEIKRIQMLSDFEKRHPTNNK